MAKKSEESPMDKFVGVIMRVLVIGVLGYVLLELAIGGVFTPNIDYLISKHKFDEAQRQVSYMATQASTGAITWETYRAAYYQLLNAEVNYLLSDGGDLSVDRLVSLLNEHTMSIVPFCGETSDKDLIKANELYNIEIERHHTIMDDILSKAIITNNEYLARSIVNCYRPFLVKQQVPTHIWEKNTYEYSYSYERKNMAEERIDQAIKEGKL